MPTNKLLCRLCLAIALLGQTWAHAGVGADGYQTHCQQCHGPLERTNEPFFPSLTERARNLTPKAFVAAVMNGKLDRAGDFVSHLRPGMPAHDYLANETIAAIVTFLYRQAGQQQVSVSVEQVAQARAAAAPDDSAIVLTQQQYEGAERQYFELCAGCHGIDRLGLSGTALDSLSLEDKDPRSLMQTIHYGSPWGMPNWGSSNQLTTAQMSAMARYLKLPARQAPTFTLEDAKASWQLLLPVKERPKRRAFAVATKHLFVSLLHDTGQLALIDGPKRQIAHIVDTDLAPHTIDLSADGRYLYVIARSGHLALVDLNMAKPEVVARVRVGYESRSVAVSADRRRPLVAAGGYSQPQVTLLDARTLAPLTAVRLDQNAEPSWTEQSALVQLIATNRKGQFLAVANNQTGLSLLTATNKRGDAGLSISHIDNGGLLGHGSFDLSRRYFIAPANTGEIVAFDLKAGSVIAKIPVAGLTGGSMGTAYNDVTHGPVWAMSAPGQSSVVSIGTDPKHHPQSAWRLVRQLPLPGGGALHSAAHPKSARLWTDLTLHSNPAWSGAAIAINHTQVAPEPKVVQLREAQGSGETFMKAIHPQFSSDGSEVWYTLWNRQDLPAAIAVVDDQSQSVTALIRDARLITPIRTYSASALLKR